MSRMSGAALLQQIYDDLGISKPPRWHHRSDEDNVAHNWNSGQSMSSIFHKLISGRSDWDQSVRNHLRDGSLSRNTFELVKKHYLEGGDNPTSAIPTLEREAAESVQYAKDYWTGEYSDLTVPGKGLDLSPHTDVSRTWYSMERIDQRLDDSEYSRSSMRQIHDNTQAKFLDEVYNADTGEVNEGVQAHWGLDLRRVGLQDHRRSWLLGAIDIISNDHPMAPHRNAQILDGLNLTAEYYESLTKGDVNWASYRNDKAYQKAFESKGWDISKLGEAGEVERDVAWIREINSTTDVIKQEMANDSDGWKYNWEGRYDPDQITSNGRDLYIDGERQESPSEMYAIDPNTGYSKMALLNPDDYNQWEDEVSGTIKEKEVDVVKPEINIPKVEVKRPSNIPASWGSVKL